MLARTGSLARIPAHLIRVLPKVRTPPAGSSVRALSRNACVLGPGVEARWHQAPARDLGTQPSGERVNYLLLPWPLRIRASDFRPVRGPLQRLANDPFGFFEFAPSERLDLDLVDRMLAAARDQAGAVDVVVLPESAVEDTEIEDLETLLARHGVTGLITGIRERPAQPGRFPRNWVHIGVSADGQWMHIRQSKHHRWSLDDAQIRQYHLGGPLHPHTRWWEAIEVPPRSVQFVEFGDGVTLASLVCEDLAQTDDVASVIRSVGPMIVVTPLLDGPQLSSRWAARYASVLADDPGSAVLTLTSFGMAQRSGLPGQSPSPVVALWKSPGQQTREISLEPGAQGILLSASIARATRRSFDGRPPERQRQRILRRQRPAGPGRQHRHRVTALTTRLTTPAHPGRRGTHDPGDVGAGSGRSTNVRARTHRGGGCRCPGRRPVACRTRDSPTLLAVATQHQQHVPCRLPGRRGGRRTAGRVFGNAAGAVQQADSRLARNPTQPPWPGHITGQSAAFVSHAPPAGPARPDLSAPARIVDSRPTIRRRQARVGGRTHPGGTLADYLDYLRDKITRYGWAVQGVERDRIHPPWAYTVGLTPHGRPELAVTGLPLGRATRLLGDVAEHVMHAAAPRPGEQIALRGGPLIEIVTVAEPSAHLLMAIRLYGPGVRALQVVHADDRGHWPWGGRLPRRPGRSARARPARVPPPGRGLAQLPSAPVGMAEDCILVRASRVLDGADDLAGAARRAGSSPARSGWR